MTVFLTGPAEYSQKVDGWNWPMPAVPKGKPFRTSPGSTLCPPRAWVNGRARRQARVFCRRLFPLGRTQPIDQRRQDRFVSIQQRKLQSGGTGIDDGDVLGIQTHGRALRLG